jgi:hypothetical protein
MTPTAIVLIVVGVIIYILIVAFALCACALAGRYDHHTELMYRELKRKALKGQLARELNNIGGQNAEPTHQEPTHSGAKAS